MRALAPFFLLLVGSALGQAYPVLPAPPEVRVELTAEPKNASSEPFRLTSRARMSGGRLLCHRVFARYVDRTGQEWVYDVLGSKTPLSSTSCPVSASAAVPPYIEARWSLKNDELPFTPGNNTESRARRMTYGPYPKAGLTSAQGYAPGLYRFEAHALVGYSLKGTCTDPDGNTYTCYEDRTVSARAEEGGASIYIGSVTAVGIRNLLYYYQVKHFYKELGESGGTVEGPFSPDPGRWGKPWLGGVLQDIPAESSLGSYLRDHGLKGFLADNVSTYPPSCRGICASYEAYDPDWVVGRGEVPEEALAVFRAFVESYAKDASYQHGRYTSRALSSVFDPGEYKVKGFLMLLTPERTYLFLSKSGKFTDGEEIGVLELFPNVGPILLNVMRWKEMRERLRNCTANPEACKERR